MRAIGAYALLASLLWILPFSADAAVSVQNLRQWRAPDHTRLVFDLSGALEHRVFTLNDPDRIVIDDCFNNCFKRMTYSARTGNRTLHPSLINLGVPSIGNALFEAALTPVPS